MRSRGRIVPSLLAVVLDFREAEGEDSLPSIKKIS
jgi:hypothetical protein